MLSRVTGRSFVLFGRLPFAIRVALQAKKQEFCRP